MEASASGQVLLTEEEEEEEEEEEGEKKKKRESLHNKHAVFVFRFPCIIYKPLCVCVCVCLCSCVFVCVCVRVCVCFSVHKPMYSLSFLLHTRALHLWDCQHLQFVPPELCSHRWQHRVIKWPHTEEWPIKVPHHPHHPHYHWVSAWGNLISFKGIREVMYAFKIQYLLDTPVNSQLSSRHKFLPRWNWPVFYLVFNFYYFDFLNFLLWKLRYGYENVRNHGFKQRLAMYESHGYVCSRRNKLNTSINRLHLLCHIQRLSHTHNIIF